MVAQATQTAQQNRTLRTFDNDLERFNLHERFEQLPLIITDYDITSGVLTPAQAAFIIRGNKNFIATGVNATSALVTIPVGGGITLTTAGADTDQMILRTHSDAIQTLWDDVNFDTGEEPSLRVGLAAPATITTMTLWAGVVLTDPANNDVSTDADQARFYYKAGVNSGKWAAAVSIGGTDTLIDLDVTVVASTYYELQMDINADRKADFFINGVHRGQSGALTDLQSTPRISVGVETNAASARSFTCRGIDFGRKYANA